MVELHCVRRRDNATGTGRVSHEPSVLAGNGVLPLSGHSTGVEGWREAASGFSALRVPIELLALYRTCICLV